MTYSVVEGGREILKSISSARDVFCFRKDLFIDLRLNVTSHPQKHHCLFDEEFISEEFGLKVMSMKYSDFSRWNPVAAFQIEVLS